MGRLENWNPNKFDEEFGDVAIERLVEAAEVVADKTRSKCPVGTISRPIYKTGPHAGKEWTARDAGQLKKSVRVTQKKSKYGKILFKKRNVRVYIGDYKVHYASIVEHTRPFMRPAFYASLSEVARIIGVK